MRALALTCLALALALAAPAAAQAAPTLSVRIADREVRYGAAHQVTGTLADGAVALPGQLVILQGRRYPYRGAYRELAHTTTDAAGAFSFAPQLDRNHELRVLAPGANASTVPMRAYVYPAVRLTFRALRPGVVRLSQRYTLPRAVRLHTATFFYLGSRAAARSSRRVSAPTRRVRAGRYSAQLTVRLPAAWHGRFRYASCFRTTPGTGLGDPDAACPRRFAF